jgi:hypothetical protein
MQGVAKVFPVLNSIGVFQRRLKGFFPNILDYLKGSIFKKK